MKVINFKKKQEEEEKKASEQSGDVSGNVQMKSSVFLKGTSSAKIANDSNSILSSLFAALDSKNQEEAESKIKMVQSSQATKFKKQSSQVINTKGTKKDNTKAKLPIGTIKGGLENNPESPEAEQFGSGELNFEPQKVSGQPRKSKESTKDQPAEFKQEENKGRASSPVKKNKPFGKVQLSDEKDVKKKEKERSRETVERNNKKAKNLLMGSCEKALEKLYESKKQTSSDKRTISRVSVLVVEIGSYKGFLLFAQNNKNSTPIEEFRKEIVGLLKESGLIGEISSELIVDVEVENYASVVEAFSEFSLNFLNDKGEWQVVSFVKREVVRPVLSESDKEDMYLVDIKIIPPNTPVNFDAFLFLPRNNRYVRYLKDGCSLSLKQAKRHTEEEEGQSKLYLPKEHKNKFIQFYIKNTLNWEFALHKKNKKEVA